jgi:hypothetical protein
VLQAEPGLISYERTIGTGRYFPVFDGWRIELSDEADEAAGFRAKIVGPTGGYLGSPAPHGGRSMSLAFGSAMAVEPAIISETWTVLMAARDLRDEDMAVVCIHVIECHFGGRMPTQTELDAIASYFR